MITLNKITKKYDSFQLIIDSLKINNGSFHSLLGPSGCGKTTLLNIIAGIVKPDKGEINVDGNLITQIPPEQRNFAMVAQQPLLFHSMTVEDNIAFSLKVRNVDKTTIKKRVKDLLEMVHLSDVNKKRPHQLSGGQQQRVSIARSLAHKPQLLLMDEPFSALDPDLRESMRNMIKSIHKELKITILFVTHSPSEASMLCDTMSFIYNGKILQHGSPEELYKNPANETVASFFGHKNIIKSTLIQDMHQKNGNKDNNTEKSIILKKNDIQLKSNALHKGSINDCYFSQGIYEITILWNKTELYTTSLKPLKIGDTINFDIIIDESTLRINAKEFNCID